MLRFSPFARRNHCRPGAVISHMYLLKHYIMEFAAFEVRSHRFDADDSGTNDSGASDSDASDSSASGWTKDTECAAFAARGLQLTRTTGRC